MRIRIKAKTFFFAFAVLLLHGCASHGPQMDAGPYSGYAPTSAVLPPAFSRPQTIVHQVGPAETLWRIAKIYNVDMKSIMRANGLADPTLIKNGQELTIPNTRGPIPVIPLYPNHKWTHIVIHHTATENGNAHTIDKLHQRRGFWNGLGYHFLIDNGTGGKWDGQIEAGPRWIKQRNGAHCNANGMNEHGIGIALVGNYSETYVSENSLRSLVYLVKTLQDYYNIPVQNVVGHRDVPGKNTECPGNHFPWLEFKHRLSLP